MAGTRMEPSHNMDWESRPTDTLLFYVNGKKIEDSEVDPEWTLLEYLRKKLCIRGTKLGCGEGGCGACTVMMSRTDGTTIKHFSVNACLAPVCSMHGAAVTTVEGIGNTVDGLHPVQERLANAHGSQCGFCTPGFVMSMYTLLRNNPKPSYHELEDYLQGNLCRCTGYRPIMEGYRSFLSNGMEETTKGGGCGKPGGCCMDKKSSDGCVAIDVSSRLHDATSYRPYDPTQEPIFPPELQLDQSIHRSSLKFKGPTITWYRPATLTQLLDLRAKHPQAKIVVGNTELGVETRLKFLHYPVLISISSITDLMALTVTEEGLEVGAAVTLTKLEDELKKQLKTYKEDKCQIFAAILEMLQWFGSRQIRNVACLGGNIMTGSPISDLNPIFMASGTKLKFKDKSGERIVNMVDFYTGYRENAARPTEVLISVVIPFAEEDQYFWSYKQARRKDDDIAIVNAAFNVHFKKQSGEIKELTAAYGGMAPTTVMASKLMEAVKGRSWNTELMDVATDTLMAEFPLSVDTPGGHVQYRRSLVLSFFFKFFLRVQKKLTNNTKTSAFLEELESKKVPHSCQVFQKVPSSQKDYDLIGRPVVHTSAFKQVSGEAVYTDDVARLQDELYGAIVQSTCPAGDILSIDPSKALAMDGVEAFFSAKDISKENNFVAPDEEVFASEKVMCQGQVIGLIVAKDRLVARRAARAVDIKYKPRKPIITIEEAIENESFFDGSPKEVGSKDVEEKLKECQHVLEGDTYTGPQEHFYLEPHALIAIPKEGEMEIIAGTQDANLFQMGLAHVLGIPANRITIRVKRIGGGFGGKEQRFGMFMYPAAVAATKLRRPVRIVLDRDEDMSITGGRNPFRTFYKVGFSAEGKVIALDIKFYVNAGFSLDLSDVVCTVAMFKADNAYWIPHLRARGWVCRTNLPSNTAIRGFGAPQSMFACETVMDRVAQFLDIPPDQVRHLNMYKEGQITHLGNPNPDSNARRCYEQCIQDSDYHKKLQQVEEFNKNNKWKKRGVAIIPTRYGITFGAKLLHQAAALIHIYTDGSVLVTSGGVEMGQGLHTKLIQVVTRSLGVPQSKVYISEMSTDKTPNTSPSAASLCSDLNGMAVLNACEKLLSRLEPIRSEHKEASWEEIIGKAYVERISLSATGFYKSPDVESAWEHPDKTFMYYVNGAATSMVEIDCLTGDHQVLSTDIVMDIGQSLNPAIDIGQIEGGWMQGYGLYTMEQPLISPNGYIFSRGPGNYKIPGFSDMPKEFNVALLQGSSNPRAIYSSKAVGEPPLFLAASAFFAIKSAISAARKESGLTGYFRMEAPATSEKIRLACQDKLTEKSQPKEDPTKKPWYIQV